MNQRAELIKHNSLSIHIYIYIYVYTHINQQPQEESKRKNEEEQPRIRLIKGKLENRNSIVMILKKLQIATKHEGTANHYYNGGCSSLNLRSLSDSEP